MSIERRFCRMAVVWIALAWICTGISWAGGLGFGRKAPAYVPSSRWEGYFVNDKGVASPLLQPLEQNDDKSWMFLRFTNYPGARIRVAVMKVENRTATAEAANDTNAAVVTREAAQVPVSGIEEMLTTSIFNTNRFELVDRKDIEKSLSEQDLGASGRAKKGTAVKTGQILGADYLIYASVNEWTSVRSRTGGSGGSSAGALGLLGVQRTSSEVAMSFRVVDAATSKVVFQTTERATAGSWGIALGGISSGKGGAVDFERASPIGYAVQSCINKGTYKLATWIKERPWSAVVAQVDGQSVYVNSGANGGLASGVELVALKQGKEVFDPVTGESLGQPPIVMGTLRVVKVLDKFSIAEVVEGCKGIQKGDRLELKTSPTIVITSKP